MKWQKDMLTQIYGRYDRKTHKRAVREAYIEIPKKNGKSALLSALGLYHLVMDGYYTKKGDFVPELGPEVYTLATTVKQAGIIHDSSKWMVQQSPHLIQEVRPMQYSIKLRNKPGEYIVLSSEAEANEGLNGNANLIDELHAHKDGGKNYTTIKGSGASREQPITIIISTAGVHDPTSIGWNRHEYARRVIANPELDPSFYGLIYAGSDKWTDEKCLKEKNISKCNPGWGEIVNPDFIMSKAVEAKNDPSMMNYFKRYHLNIWVSSHSQWIEKKFYRACNKGGEKQNKGKKCWVGMDLGATDDLTALCTLFMEKIDGQEFFKAEMDFFCTANKMDAIKNNSSHITYMLWARDGYMNIAGEDVTDYRYIEEEIHERIKNHNVRSVNYDPYAAVELVQSLGRKYMGKGKDFLNPTGMNAKSLSPPMKKILEVVKKEEIEFYKDPVLEWMFDNVMVKIDANDNIFPNKKEAKGKIDGVIALILAFDGYLHDKYLNQDKIMEFTVI